MRGKISCSLSFLVFISRIRTQSNCVVTWRVFLCSIFPMDFPLKQIHSPTPNTHAFDYSTAFSSSSSVTSAAVIDFSYTHRFSLLLCHSLSRSLPLALVWARATTKIYSPFRFTKCTARKVSTDWFKLDLLALSLPKIARLAWESRTSETRENHH